MFHWRTLAEKHLFLYSIQNRSTLPFLRLECSIACSFRHISPWSSYTKRKNATGSLFFIISYHNFYIVYRARYLTTKQNIPGCQSWPRQGKNFGRPYSATPPWTGTLVWSLDILSETQPLGGGGGCPRWFQPSRTSMLFNQWYLRNFATFTKI